MRTPTSLFIVSLFAIRMACPVTMSAQCSAVESAIQEAANRLHPKVQRRDADVFEKTVCWKLEQMPEDEFVILGRGLETVNWLKNDPSVEYNILETVDYRLGVACQYIFIRKTGATKPVRYHRSQRAKLEELLKIKQQQLRDLKKNQSNLSTQILDILGDVLVAEIDTPAPLNDAIQTAAGQLKKEGIDALSRYYQIDYEPLENSRAETVRRIVTPIDNIMNSAHVPLGKWAKYWDALRLTPDLGMVAGNLAAKIRIYFFERDLEEEIEDLKARLEMEPLD